MELLTIGYEGRTLPQTVRLLREQDVERLVDVRARPQSHKPGFSSLALFDGLRKAGIAYDSDRALGTPDDVRALWRAGDLAAGRARYRKLVRGPRRARLELLVAIVSFERVCILCFEADPARCHRSVIAEEAVRLRPELVVRHL
jgi:uncharacterized protein (DUF488 family)